MIDGNPDIIAQTGEPTHIQTAAQQPYDWQVAA